MQTRWTIRFAAVGLACDTLAAQATSPEQALRVTLDRLSGPDKLLGISAAVALSKDEKYGLAEQMRPSQWGVTWGHDGWSPGYLTEVLYYPDRKTANAVQVNTEDQREMKMAVFETGGPQ